MKIILKKDYDLLGDEGQILEVKSGYARNFLIPNGIATIATESNLKSFEEIRKQRKRKIDKMNEEAKKLSSDLSKNVIEFAVKSGEDGKMFGSVTAQMIYDKLTERGFQDIERKRIILKEAIKSLGEHDVEIKLQTSVIAKIKVNVIAEKPHSENVTPDENAEVKEDSKPSEEKASE